MKMVLIIDDEVGVRDYLRRFLENSGYGVVLAENGAEGLAILENYSPHLVLTDIIMTCTDGLTVLRKMRDRNANIPIVAMTGGDNHFDSSHLLQVAKIEQADALLKKPFSCDELLDVVRKLTE